jgi:hypothetical protein
MGESLVMLAVAFGVLARPLLRNSRFNLRMAMMGVAGAAIFAAYITEFLRLGRFLATVEIESADGDLAAIAHEILSSAVLEDALNRELSTLPLFANSTDHGTELRRMAQVDTSPRPRAVRLSVTTGSYHDGAIILNAILESARNVLGPQRVRALGPVEFHSSWRSNRGLFLLALWYVWLLCFYLMLKYRGWLESPS